MIELTDKNFKIEVLKPAGLPVFVYFWALWCGPCQMASPVVEELAGEYEGKIKVGKINIDENSQITGKYGVMSIPTVIVFQKGKEIKKQMGFPGKEGYKKLIDEALAS